MIVTVDELADMCWLQMQFACDGKKKEIKMSPNMDFVVILRASYFLCWTSFKIRLLKDFGLPSLFPRR